MSFIINYKPPRIALGLVLSAGLAHILAPISLHANLPAAAVLLALGGFSLMLRGWWLFREAGTAICPTAGSTTLITHDVYAVTRNPMYLGILLMLVAVATATGGVVFYVAALLFAVTIDRVFCPYEELKAVSEFGDDYLQYKQTVRRWL